MPERLSVTWGSSIVLAICLALLPARAGADDWGARRNPFDVNVVRRYKAVLAKDPHDAGALRQLIALYRRYRSVAKLEDEYRAYLAVREDWATLVVLARMPRTSSAETLALWRRALKAAPEDGRGWLAVGDALPDAASARDAFVQAARLAKSARDKRVALLRLVSAAKSANDPTTQDSAYVELIALAPKDGGLWLERGNAQLAAGKFGAAIDSFTHAAALLTTDPERRLMAMMNQGTALERLGRADDAIAQYLRTLDKVPRGFYLGTEVVMRIIDTERRRHSIGNAIALLEKRWPERTRGHFEWATLGDLYKEDRKDEAAMLAYKRAVGKAPTEIETQRKLIVLLDKLRPDEALAQHEAAARVAPGDADLQLELAKRYHPTDPDKAFAVLNRLSKRLPNNVNVRVTIAALYEQWDEPLPAIVEYEAVVRLEPNELDHVIVLGDAYWRADDPDRARSAWTKLALVNTATSHLRHGEILAMHELWADAVVAYSKSIALDGTNPKAWHGRAQANDSLGNSAKAIDDARRAVALIGNATRENGDRERYLLVKVLRTDAPGEEPLAKTLQKWRFAFEHGDNAAGYLLATHHARIGSRQQHEILVELYRRVPTDASLGLALARSYVNRKDFAGARSTLEDVARRYPARAEAIGKLIAQVEDDRVKAELEARWEEEGVPESERRRHISAGRAPDLIGRHRRFGARLQVGADVYGTESALIGFGLYRTHGVAPGTSIEVRLDWSGRDDQDEEVNAVGVGAAVTRRLLDLQKFEVAGGIGPRVELRYGTDQRMSSWDRAALSGDVTLQVVPRAMWATLGARFNHSVTDPARGSTLLLELGFELR